MGVDSSDLISKANDLAGDIRKSDLYRNYREAVEKLKQDEQLVKKIAFFKKENIKYQTKVFQKVNPSFDEEKYVSSLYNELMLVEVCRDFIECEAKILELLAGTLNIISSSCELEFEVFENTSAS